MRREIATLEVRREHDVVAARQQARLVAQGLGFDHQAQVRLATAVSELVRNAFQYARGGRVEFHLEDRDSERLLVVRIVDEGPGIRNLDQVLNGTYVSTTGMGLGLVGARRLSDRFEITSAPGAGTTIELGKLVPGARRMTIDNALASIRAELARHRGDNLLLELQEQNQELLRVIQELRERQDEVERLNRELEETNRGVLALYAELDDRAVDLKRASEMKSRFLSSISHELRTPLSSVVNMARLLIARTDGELTAEQERQVTLLRDSALGLMEMVNDLLDLAKIEAGKTTLRLTEVSAVDLISALRGMFRPLVDSSAVKLVFDDPDPRLLLHTDEGKLSQVLRNFISNALKFTATGEVRIATRAREDDRVEFSVADTGIGIAPEDQDRIFEEFAQVEGRHQRKVKGTGLGLSLSKKIAELLGGSISLESTPDVGSVFTLVIPRVHPDVATADAARLNGETSTGQGSPERAGHV